MKRIFIIEVVRVSVYSIFIPIAINCLNPSKHSDDVIAQVDSQDLTLIAELPPVQDIPEPIGVEGVPAKVQATARDAQVAMVAMVLPFSQTVTVKWSCEGHAALCHIDRARIKIIANRDGQPFIPLTVEARGYMDLWGWNTGVEVGRRNINLPAGTYVVQAVAAGDYSSASITAEYVTTESKSLPPKAYLGLAAGAVTGGLLLLLKR